MPPPGLDDDMDRHSVLVVSPDPLSAALLGAAIELAGHAPRFPQHDESARAALMRVRPRLVAVDCDHDDACSEAFLGPALMTGSRVILFRSRRTKRDASELSERLGLRVVDMPLEHESLTRLLQELTA
jgi:DNA-binding NtrC family response regulator